MRLGTKRSRPKVFFGHFPRRKVLLRLPWSAVPKTIAGRIDMEQASDSELLKRALQGHPDAFSTLVRRHDRYLYRVREACCEMTMRQKTSYSRLIFRLI